MVEVSGKRTALDAIKTSVKRLGITGVLGVVAVGFLYTACTVRVLPNEMGVEQRKFGFKVGIVEKTFGPGLYVVGPGGTMHTFSREMHVLEAAGTQSESSERAHLRSSDAAATATVGCCAHSAPYGAAHRIAHER